MKFELVLLIVVCSYLRKQVKNTEAEAEWSGRLQIAMFFAIGLIALSASWSWFRTLGSILANLALFGIGYLVLTEEVFKRFRFIVYSFLPFLAITVTEDILTAISKSLGHSLHTLFEVAQFFSIIWLIVMLFTYNKQRKSLEKERLRAAEKERELRITESLRAELEVQVHERTAELRLQKEELEKTIIDLKSTQDQLIHAEKMASLGELTAGIAHEIQNPLNFVNNFAEVNFDLIDEIKFELQAGNTEEVIAIANDLKENNQKIAHHGKRADSIVKGMLQHSRKSTGTKEPTDINVLLDECIRLSYHGIRAKDKSFNANFKLDLDPQLGKIDVIPQDIGRVFLNLFNNAFYAVTEKKEKCPEDYEPLLTVKSYKEDDKIIITISDNGNGIPLSVQEKIFQPFFTTKPTGKGTGLGLSISYDIIVKGHLGKISIDTKETDHTTFIIELPA